MTITESAQKTHAVVGEGCQEGAGVVGVCSLKQP